MLQPEESLCRLGLLEINARLAQRGDARNVAFSYVYRWSETALCSFWVAVEVIADQTYANRFGANAQQFQATPTRIPWYYVSRYYHFHGWKVLPQSISSESRVQVSTA